MRSPSGPESLALLTSRRMRHGTPLLHEARALTSARPAGRRYPAAEQREKGRTGRKDRSAPGGGSGTQIGNQQVNEVPDLLLRSAVDDPVGSIGAGSAAID